MRTYTVHEPQPAPTDLDEWAARLVFVREGFAWLAFIAPVIWLLYNRLWRTLFYFLVVSAALFALVSLIGGNQTAFAWTGLLINLAFGFEARDLYRSTLARRDYRQIGVVTGRDLEDCERRFLSEWLIAGGQARAGAAPTVSSASATMTASMGAGGGLMSASTAGKGA